MALQKMNVESFNLDHTKVKAPYIRVAGYKEGKVDQVVKYDIRFTQPNVEQMPMRAMHTLEHLLAENIRNYSDDVIDVSPMGCQTGFYMAMMNFDSVEKMSELVEKTLNDVLAAEEIPAQNEVQCGFASAHDLKGAKHYAEKMLAGRDEWDIVFG
ncbi:S-ribosylhomocysteine lyase [Exiguobacterium acetylicum]|jgi:S-ribosylhomocysteine lyase|uniref:S-ribosylhomocysteine lyase n=1 Tax=Exiguobacterium acetylicum TaxID=41170 RepID=A0ABX8G7T3_EXIAC|nr:MULTISPECIES: S-ribosylhomocysteine lyase [Exiguobacterium]AOT01516.1 S-ribosylhomocysteine lyase [Exiguobacterium sp. U13-1]EZP60365.1 S-ribosylhomocysteine lyase [Exiguobacterium sp. RIT341]KOP30081.1 S-ribosylhomocysteine lyase [Exiguobacterium sp. BMC-KP]KQS39537.1 S-ribosylhomocysteine lyase [Exiguobacterium sp. Leaf196]QWB29471.1 S-ribosylhomocysteine lyase [Exiguobacterium acetylicum]